MQREVAWGIDGLCRVAVLIIDPASASTTALDRPLLVLGPRPSDSILSIRLSINSESSGRYWCLCDKTMASKVSGSPTPIR
jgi:hypothetical protein